MQISTYNLLDMGRIANSKAVFVRLFCGLWVSIVSGCFSLFDNNDCSGFALVDHVDPTYWVDSDSITLRFDFAAGYCVGAEYSVTIEGRQFGPYYTGSNPTGEIPLEGLNRTSSELKVNITSVALGDHELTIPVPQRRLLQFSVAADAVHFGDYTPSDPLSVLVVGNSAISLRRINGDIIWNDVLNCLKCSNVVSAYLQPTDATDYGRLVLGYDNILEIRDSATGEILFVNEITGAEEDSVAALQVGYVGHRAVARYLMEERKGEEVVELQSMVKMSHLEILHHIPSESTLSIRFADSGFGVQAFDGDSTVAMDRALDETPPQELNLPYAAILGVIDRDGTELLCNWQYCVDLNEFAGHASSPEFYYLFSDGYASSLIQQFFEWPDGPQIYRELKISGVSMPWVSNAQMPGVIVSISGEIEVIQNGERILGAVTPSPVLDLAVVDLGVASNKASLALAYKSDGYIRVVTLDSHGSLDPDMPLRRFSRGTSGNLPFLQPYPTYR